MCGRIIVKRVDILHICSSREATRYVSVARKTLLAGAFRKIGTYANRNRTKEGECDPLLEQP